MTAFTTLPFLAWPSGVDSFTAAVIMSPSPAFNPVEPPSGGIICSLRAPELSATSSIDLIITAMASISLLLCHPEAGAFCLPKDLGAPRNQSRVFCEIAKTRVWRASSLARHIDHRFRHQRSLPHNIFQLPALQLRQRTRLLDPHHIADVRFVLLVVRIELLVARDHAPVERMRLLARHLHHNRFLHAVGDHFSHYFLAAALHLRRGLCIGSRHYFFSVAVERSRSPAMVLTRAISLRRPRIFFRLSVW